MKVKNPFCCDICQKLKGDTNHWWLRPTHYSEFQLFTWTAELADSDTVEHICSEACAAKSLSKWMQKTTASLRVNGSHNAHQPQTGSTAAR